MNVKEVIDGNCYNKEEKRKYNYGWKNKVIDGNCYNKEEKRKYNYGWKNKKSGFAKRKFSGKNNKREVKNNVNEQYCRKGDKSVLPSSFKAKQFPNQDLKMKGRNNCDYYRNLSTYSEKRVFYPEDQWEEQEYCRPLMAIPSPVTFLPTQTLNERNRVINSLKGQVQAYKEILAHQKKESFSSKVNLASEKMSSLVKTRHTLESFIQEDSVIIKAINIILEDESFYEECEFKIKVLNTLLEQRAGNYQDMLSELNIEELLENKRELTSLKERLEDAHKEIKCLSLFSENKNNLEITRGLKIGQNFVSWKDEYYKLQSSSDKKVEALCLSMEKCANYFRGFNKGVVNEEITQFNFGHCEHALHCFSDEMAHSEKMKVIPSTCIEVLKEIKQRIAKINNVEIVVNDLSKLKDVSAKKSTVIHMSAIKERKTLYPSLLSFANASRILPHMKYTITKNIFHSLSELHEKDSVYIYLSPQNVLISGGGAILCSVDTVSRNEPIPDFKFFSPEIDSLNSGEHLEGDFSSINPAADYYSLGKMIIWLSSIGLNKNFIEHEMNIIKLFPFMGKLVSEDPKERLSCSEFKVFTDILPELYHASNFGSPFMDDNVLEYSIKIESDSSPSQCTAPNNLEVERNLIYKEMEGSEDDDNDDGDDADDDDIDDYANNVDDDVNDYVEANNDDDVKEGDKTNDYDDDVNDDDDTYDDDYEANDDESQEILEDSANVS